MPSTSPGWAARTMKPAGSVMVSTTMAAFLVVQNDSARIPAAVAGEAGGFQFLQIGFPHCILVAAELVEVFPGKNAAGMLVGENRFDAIVADRLDANDADIALAGLQRFLAVAVAAHLGGRRIHTQQFEGNRNHRPIVEGDFHHARLRADFEGYGRRTRTHCLRFLFCKTKAGCLAFILCGPTSLHEDHQIRMASPDDVRWRCAVAAALRGAVPASSPACRAWPLPKPGWGNARRQHSAESRASARVASCYPGWRR